MSDKPGIGIEIPDLTMIVTTAHRAIGGHLYFDIKSNTEDIKLGEALIVMAAAQVLRNDPAAGDWSKLLGQYAQSRAESLQAPVKASDG